MLHSELSRSEKQRTLQAVKQQKLSLLYLSPETLLSIPVWKIISQPEVKITGIILDESTLLNSMGNYFSPCLSSFGGRCAPSLLKSKPTGTKIAIAAFTATADPQAQQEIIQALELKRPETFLVSPYRSNLSLNLKTVWTPKGRKQKMLQFIQAKQKQSGLVYVRSRQDSQALAAWFSIFKLFCCCIPCRVNYD